MFDIRCNRTIWGSTVAIHADEFVKFSGRRTVRAAWVVVRANLQNIGPNVGNIIRRKDKGADHGNSRENGCFREGGDDGLFD